VVSLFTRLRRVNQLDSVEIAHLGLLAARRSTAPGGVVDGPSGASRIGLSKSTLVTASRLRPSQSDLTLVAATGMRALAQAGRPLVRTCDSPGVAELAIALPPLLYVSRLQRLCRVDVGLAVAHLRDVVGTVTPKVCSTNTTRSHRRCECQCRLSLRSGEGAGLRRRRQVARSTATATPVALATGSLRHNCVQRQWLSFAGARIEIRGLLPPRRIRA